MGGELKGGFWNFISSLRDALQTHKKFLTPVKGVVIRETSEIELCGETVSLQSLATVTTTACCSK